VRADPADQKRLLDLQDLDVKLARAAATLKKLPEQERVDQAESALAAARATEREGLHALEELQAELTRAENDVELVEKRSPRDQERSEHTALCEKTPSASSTNSPPFANVSRCWKTSSSR
jgi:hypothetical protein